MYLNKVGCIYPSLYKELGDNIVTFYINKNSKIKILVVEICAALSSVVWFAFPRRENVRSYMNQNGRITAQQQSNA